MVDRWQSLHEVIAAATEAESDADALTYQRIGEAGHVRYWSGSPLATADLDAEHAAADAFAAACGFDLERDR